MKAVIVVLNNKIIKIIIKNCPLKNEILYLKQLKAVLLHIYKIIIKVKVSKNEYSYWTDIEIWAHYGTSHKRQRRHREMILLVEVLIDKIRFQSIFKAETVVFFQINESQYRLIRFSIKSLNTPSIGFEKFTVLTIKVYTCESIIRQKPSSVLWTGYRNKHVFSLSFRCGL